MPATLPMYELELTEIDGVHYVFDPVRKKAVVLTPEEYVRQCLIIYLQEELGIARGLISLERGLKYDQRQKRYDLLVYDREGKPLLLCECKAPDIPMDNKVIFQLSTYNSKIGARCLLITNGREIHAFGLKNGEWISIYLPETGVEKLVETPEFKDFF